jgi:Fur family iron response transcriptional regulator
MPQAVQPAIREELRRAGLPRQGSLARLLALLRAAPDTHLRLADVVRMATEAGLPMTPAEIARQLETLADLGLLGRLLSTAAEPLFDTVPRPHFHLVYEETAETVDLDVSPETLLAILRQALAERPDRVEVLVRFRHDPAPGSDGAKPAGQAQCPRRPGPAASRRHKTPGPDQAG